MTLFRALDRLTGKMFPVGIIDYSIQSVYIEEPNGLYGERDFDEVGLVKENKMVELRDIVDLIIMDNNDPIYIFDDNNEMFEYGVDDISDILSHYTDTITIYDGMVEICLQD